eukprot:TRINITY_DN2323_c0_g1_i12.p1 TRINITY_DN2323_c0_g1~~TRINITY_DN2323_c0_g1_i12.p1  ORF type:complete len:106 (+),score=5.17 TRINITY_DN2323_c0_g1_i12:120-437(+)
MSFVPCLSFFAILISVIVWYAQRYEIRFDDQTFYILPVSPIQYNANDTLEIINATHLTPQEIASLIVNQVEGTPMRPLLLVGGICSWPAVHKWSWGIFSFMSMKK